MKIPSSDRAQKWSYYSHKPKCQVDWDAQVQKAAKSVAATLPQGTNKDFRPRLFDKLSGWSALLDTGAACSVWPKGRAHLPVDPNKKLQAVNGSRIDTFGNKNIKVQFGNNIYHHDVIVASVYEPIIGFDF